MDRRTIAERFVALTENVEGHLLWRGSLRHGYGRFWVAGRLETATHVAWAMGGGRTLRPGEILMHSCDTPRCVTFAHLRPATQLDNVRDCVEKGRIGRRYVGETHVHARLTWAAVDTIRASHGVRGVGGISAAQLARDFGVSVAVIHSVLEQRSWRTQHRYA